MDNSITFAKVGCEIINSFVYNLGRSDQQIGVDPVQEHIQVFDFPSPKINAEQEKWETWMTSFSMLVEDNAKAGRTESFDVEQNQLLDNILSTIKFKKK